jgi:LmbE family N-acetylglucosaminyl deacetylase
MCACDVVLTIHPQDYHPDHYAVSQLVVERAIFVAGLKKYAPDDTTWHPHQFFLLSLRSQDKHSPPDIIVDISDVWAEKKKALECSRLSKRHEKC